MGPHGHGVARGAPDYGVGAEVFAYARTHGLIMTTCNRDDFLILASGFPEHPGLIILIRRRTRQAECGKMLNLLQRAGEAGLRGNVNFA